MRLPHLSADPHPLGHRIDLTWTNPSSDATFGVRVVRGEGSYPTTPDDGVVVADAPGLTSAVDDDRMPETVYYYTLFTYSGTPSVVDRDVVNRASAMATGRYDFAGRLYSLLPAIYRRYDAATGDGALQRMLQLPGSQLDQLYSYLRAASGLHDVAAVDGALLPLLAQWIGWRTDYQRAISRQRNEIRHAPRLYQTVGAIPSVDATAARLTGWSVATKEYVHNVALTNTPERLNLWASERSGAGDWGGPSLVSVNAAYAGRAGSARLADGAELFAFHTLRRHGWDLWIKRRTPDGQWEPSEPVVERPGADQNPVLALQGETLWLFWEAFQNPGPGGSGSPGHWQVRARSQSNSSWSETSVIGDVDTTRRNPAAAVDGEGGLWLLWREWTPAGWQIRFNRHDGTAWQLDSAGSVPLGLSTIGPEDGLTVVFHPSLADRRLWVFWAGQELGGPTGQTRWSIGGLVKPSLDPALEDWAPATPPPKASTADHDRDPSVLPTPGGVELFWASTSAGGWGITSAAFDVASSSWEAAASVIDGAATYRAPSAVDLGDGTVLLVYRSNESLGYLPAPEVGASDVVVPADVPGVRTLDARYAGTTTVRSADAAKRALRGGFLDVQTYTYQTGRGGSRDDSDRIGRDTLGVFLHPGSESPDEVADAVSRLSNVLPEVLPLTTRAVLLLPP